MKFLLAFSVFILLHVLGWGAAHAWMSSNKQETLIVVDTSHAMDAHYPEMKQWLKDFQGKARYTDIVIGTDREMLGPMSGIKSTDSIFGPAFGTFSAEDLDKYANIKSDRKILLSDGSIKPSGWDTISFD